MKKTINYSGIPGLILMAALFFLPFSCSKVAVNGNTLPDNSLQLIKVSGEDVSVATKTTLSGLVTSWVATTDTVGIYSPQARTATGGGGSPIVNAEFTAASTGTSSLFNGTMYWGLGTDNHFYAYYPYSGSAGTDAAAVQITLATAQVQATANSNAHIGALDFMIATPATVTPPADTSKIGNTVVSLRYNHVFSILEFQIKRSSGSGKITKVKLTAPTINLSLTSGTINITTATPGAGVPYTISSPVGTKEITLTITGGVTPTTDYGSTPKIYMMILPGGFSAESMTIGLEYESSGVFENTTKTGKTFERSKKYVVQMDDTPSTVTDADLNVYNTIRIGSQVWMASNLKTTKYNDGTTSIPNETVDGTWGGLSTGAYCDYDNTPSNSTTYGKLYNWYAVDNNASTKGASNGGKNICPTGWHVPSAAEWTTLTDYLTNNGFGYGGSGSNIAKSMAAKSGWTVFGTAGTVGNDQASNNTSGFTALPGGYRQGIGSFEYIGDHGYWWSSIEASTSHAWYRDMGYNSSNVSSSNYDKNDGFSVRCVKD